MLFVQGMAQCFLKENPFQNKQFYAKKKKERREKINFLMSYFKIRPFESKR